MLMPQRLKKAATPDPPTLHPREEDSHRTFRDPLSGPSVSCPSLSSDTRTAQHGWFRNPRVSGELPKLRPIGPRLSALAQELNGTGPSTLGAFSLRGDQAQGHPSSNGRKGSGGPGVTHAVSLARHWMCTLWPLLLWKQEGHEQLGPCSEAPEELLTVALQSQGGRGITHSVPHPHQSQPLAFVCDPVLSST